MIASGHNSTAALLAVTAIHINEQTDLLNSYPLLLTCLFVVGIISHYLTDLIPHGHYKQPEMALKHYMARPKAERKSIPTITLLIGLADFMLSLIVFIVIFWILLGTSSLIYLGVAFAGTQLPDLIMIANKSGIGSNNKFVQIEQSFHGGPIHWHDQKNGQARLWSWTDTWQILVFVLAILECIHYYYLAN